MGGSRVTMSQSESGQCREHLAYLSSSAGTAIREEAESGAEPGAELRREAESSTDSLGMLGLQSPPHRDITGC